MSSNAPPHLSEFLAKSRQQVVRYLDHFAVEYREVAALPAWELAPHIAIWAVLGSSTTPGWFAISGDVPTDYVSSADARTARDAARHFARMWSEAADAMAAGRPHPEIKIGKPADWTRLQPLLRTRAELLRTFAADDSLW